MALVIILENMSHLAPVSNYRYRVLAGDGSMVGSKLLEQGQVIQHRRSDGWEELVRKFVHARLLGEDNYRKAGVAQLVEP